ncbi:MAG: hypothetical protein GY909_14130 [Oligoflexia bacterium]|nr:hypothetical protein [Oligoflexia bacterium]
MRVFLIALITLSFYSCTKTIDSTRAPSSKVYDIVLDLDWTLLYKVENDVPEKYGLPDKQVFRYGDETFVLSDDALEVLDKLAARDDVRISFYTGGGSERSELFGKIKLPSGKKIEDVTYKSLSFDDLKKIPGIPEDAKFFTRFKKDLAANFPNIENTLIIDDQNSVPKNQIKSLVFLEETYNWYPNLEASKRGRLDPTNDVKFRIERGKIKKAYNFVVEQLDTANKEGKTLYQVYRKFTLMPPKKMMDKSCYELISEIVRIGI